MAIWVPDPTLDPGETILEFFSANRTQGKRAVGGRLFLTDGHLRFVASRFDRALGGRDWKVGRDEVTSVSVADRSIAGGPFTGGVRRRLAVEADGQVNFFVVNGVDELAAQVSAWARREG